MIPDIRACSSCIGYSNNCPVIRNAVVRSLFLWYADISIDVIFPGGISGLFRNSGGAETIKSDREVSHS